MFKANTYSAMYKKFLGPLAQPVSLLVQTGAQYIAYETTAYVTKYQESDLIPGGSIQLGDLRLIILRENLDAVGIDSMALKDRINIDGLTYAVVHWDQYSRTIGDSGIAVEATIRGGGISVIASVFVYRITDNGDQRITSNGDNRVIVEAA